MTINTPKADKLTPAQSRAMSTAWRSQIDGKVYLFSSVGAGMRRTLYAKRLIGKGPGHPLTPKGCRLAAALGARAQDTRA